LLNLHKFILLSNSTRKWRWG